MYVPSLMMTGDAATTAAQLRLNDGLFRLGFAAYLVEAFSDVVLAWLFYVLLKPVHRDLALLSAFFGLVSMSIFAVTKMFYFAAPMFLTGSHYLMAFPPDQLDSLASLFLSLYAGLSGLSMLFYGTGWILRGYLTFRSGYLPRFLGVDHGRRRPGLCGEDPHQGARPGLFVGPPAGADVPQRGRRW